MKKVLIFIIAFICAFNVHAITLQKNVNYTHIQGSDNEKTILNVYEPFTLQGKSIKAYYNSVHYITDGVETAPMFCLDPMQYAPSKDGNNDVITVERLLYEGQNKYVIAEDYAISTIVSATKGIGKLNSNANKSTYGAVSLALRLFENGVLQNPSIADTQYDRVYFTMYLNTLKHWVDTDNKIKSLFDTACKHAKEYNSNVDCNLETYIDRIAGYLEEKAGYTVKNNGYYGSSLTNDKNSPNSSAYTDGKELFKKGLEAYNSAFTQELVEPTVTVREEYKFNREKTSYVVVSVKFNNFGDNYDTSSFKILSASAPNSIVNLLGYKVGEAPKNEYDVTTSSRNNFYELAAGNNRIYLLFKVVSTIDEETEENCNSTLTINYYYDDPLLYTGGFIRCYLDTGTLSGHFQRFIAFTNGIKAALNVPLKQCESVCQPSNSLPENCSTATTDGKGHVVANFVEGLDSSNRLNISKCIIGNTDANGNPYLVDEYRDNPYCNVYCKEDIEIKSPYKIETYSGRKINLDVTITGTQSCYTSEIDVENYKLDYEATTGQAREIVESNYNACRNINVDYTLEPNIKYTYEEKIQGNKNETNVMVKKSSTGPYSEISYCTDSDYTNCNNNMDNPYTKLETYISTTYTTPRIYYISHTQLGLIKINPIDSDDVYDLVDGLPISIKTKDGTYEYTLEFDNIGTFYNQGNGKKGRIYGGGNSLAAYGQDQPRDDYKCTYTVNLSESDYCIDESDNTYIIPRDCNPGEDEKKCKERICAKTSETQKCIKEKGVYYICTSSYFDKEKCIYQGDTNEDRRHILEDILHCTLDGSTPCKQNINCCPNCNIEIDDICPACIITNGGINVDYRTVSNNNINPNAKTMGYNWNINNSNKFIATKALYTITEIEQSENNKYNNAPDDGSDGNISGLSNNYSLRVIMTPAMATEIRRYNQTNKENGSYANGSLYCKDYALNPTPSKTSCESKGYTFENGKCYIKNIFCYSHFIDDLIEKFPDNVLAPNRSNPLSFDPYSIKGIDTPDTTIKTNGYWTIFPDFVLDNAGPAWK